MKHSIWIYIQQFLKFVFFFTVNKSIYCICALLPGKISVYTKQSSKRVNQASRCCPHRRHRHPFQQEHRHKAEETGPGECIFLRLPRPYLSDTHEVECLSGPSQLNTPPHLFLPELEPEFKSTFFFFFLLNV